MFPRWPFHKAKFFFVLFPLHNEILLELISLLFSGLLDYAIYLYGILVELIFLLYFGLLRRCYISVFVVWQDSMDIELTTNLLSLISTIDFTAMVHHSPHFFWKTIKSKKKNWSAGVCMINRIYRRITSWFTYHSTTIIFLGLTGIINVKLRDKYKCITSVFCVCVFERDLWKTKGIGPPQSQLLDRWSLRPIVRGWLDYLPCIASPALSPFYNNSPINILEYLQC